MPYIKQKEWDKIQELKEKYQDLIDKYKELDIKVDYIIKKGEELLMR